MKHTIKILSYSLIFLVVLTIIFWIVNSTFKSGDADTPIVVNNEKEVEEELIVVSGEFTCLPLKDENRPHNDLCAFGVEDDNNDYYRLQSMSDEKFNEIATLDAGQKIEVSGSFIEEESNTYKTVGTIEVSEVKVFAEKNDI